MTERLIDISDRPARLRVRYDNLVLEAEGGSQNVPLSEIAALIVSHPQVSYTHSVLAKLAEAGAVFITCDARRMPSGMLLPLQAHFIQTERFSRQAAASLPTRKRLWQQIVRAKVRAQAAVLQEVCGHDAGLLELVSRVRSGDATHIEAQASRRYWPTLFPTPGFRRDPDGDGWNVHLNYGYAVLRGIVARAVCGVGLHPSLGLHHHNRYNAFCLADDLMEPLRPLVDRVVALRARKDAGPPPLLDAESKRELLAALTGRVRIQGESRTLFDVATRMASSLAAVFEGTARKLNLPEM